MNLPNIVTFARILLIPVFVGLYFWGTPLGNFLSGVCFGIAGFTDWLDGYLARRLNQTTPFGRFIDPVADKLIVVSALGILLASYGTFWFTMPALIIIAREIVISALREWMAEGNRSGSVRVGLLAKVKTGVQMTAIACLLIAHPGEVSFWLVVGYLLIYVAAILTVWSMVKYLIVAWPSLRSGLTEMSDN